VVRITCDICSKERPLSGERTAAEAWVLGYDLELENLSGMQHYLRFLDRWDDTRILDPGAIHLCSRACKDDYMVKVQAA
jgi:hypothetical protein